MSQDIYRGRPVERADDSDELRDRAFLENIERDFYKPMMGVLASIRFPRVEGYETNVELHGRDGDTEIQVIMRLKGTPLRLSFLVTLDKKNLSLGNKGSAKPAIIVTSIKYGPKYGRYGKILSSKTFRHTWDRETYSKELYRIFVNEVFVWINTELNKKAYRLI